MVVFSMGLVTIITSVLRVTALGLTFACLLTLARILSENSYLTQ